MKSFPVALACRPGLSFLESTPMISLSFI
jgi:hypothetical protein